MYLTDRVLLGIAIGGGLWITILLLDLLKGDDESVDEMYVFTKTALNKATREG